MTAKKDYYEVLGVNKNATDNDLKRAYHKLAKEWHPDAHQDDKIEAEVKFKEINEAYEVLSDNQKRAAYDRYGHSAFENNGNNTGFTNPQDIFANFFGGDMDPFEDTFRNIFCQQRKSSRKVRGRDIQEQIFITFDEMAKGVTKEVTYSVFDKCDECNGTGAAKGTFPETCSVCNGTGMEVIMRQMPFGVSQVSQPCRNCVGKGKIVRTPCKKCDGNGKVMINKTITIDIPAGINSDQIIRKVNGGEYGEGGYGDLYVKINVCPSKFFERQGQDIYTEVEVDFITAILGGNIKIPTLDGEIDYELKSGTQPNDKIIMDGYGLPYLTRDGAGKEIIFIKVKLPTDLTPDQKEKLENFK